MIDPDPLIRAIRPVVDAVGATFVAAEAAEAGDVPIVWDGRTIAAVRLPPLHGALDRLIDAVEAELGGRLPVLSREDKQRAVRLLDERGRHVPIVTHADTRRRRGPAGARLCPRSPNRPRRSPGMSAVAWPRPVCRPVRPSVCPVVCR